MGVKKIYIVILTVAFLACVSVVGYYFYSTQIKTVDDSSSDQLVNQLSTDTSAAVDLVNGSGGEKVVGCVGGDSCYPRDLGGVDDYNGGGSFPSDGYSKSWIVCTDENNYCGTGNPKAEKKDSNTGLIWTRMISYNGPWFEANNCKYPNGLPGDDGVCDTDGEVSCICVKNTGIERKTGCEALGDGWRLPYQKELMQAYIDGSYANLSDAHTGYWASTTRSNETQSAWTVFLSYGNTSRNNKIQQYSARCVK